MKACYYCGEAVPPEVHRQVKELINFLLDSSDQFDNSFVHMTGCLPENLDDDGMTVVVCPKDAIRELSESLQPNLASWART